MRLLLHRHPRRSPLADRPQPLRKPVVILQRAQRPEGHRKRFLRSVFSQLHIGHPTASHPHCQAIIPLIQSAKTGPIALQRRRNQFRISARQQAVSWQSVGDQSLTLSRECLRRTENERAVHQNFREEEAGLSKSSRLISVDRTLDQVGREDSAPPYWSVYSKMSAKMGGTP